MFLDFEILSTKFFDVNDFIGDNTNPSRRDCAGTLCPVQLQSITRVSSIHMMMMY